ncbi:MULTISPECIES: hypothetical protein [Ramlibacter]|jgi:hypothetical protein|uniref:DUF4148 domain-containing protein n=1 Tax=Ramlibacter pinisoli TaxID=2682844 RepID=A0A6N8IUF9_9BURK|nr:MULTISPECIES: hypothetical protein [Ramlibacter]MBA2965521.1 hypothetical protein [Ramlibacter sp. CGMCC 1.13660]MVQ30487.1 hypothetical protein [Ramlibacter pinisoli]
MKKLQLTLAAALALGAQLASAQLAGPFEGGQSANALATAAPVASTLDRATVRAQGNEAARHINSRSGHQGETERAINARFTGTRSRSDVRAEALASLREGGTQVYEGGQSGAIVTRVATPVPATLASGTPALVQ